MSIDVMLLRVFTNAEGKFGNPLGVIDAGAVPESDCQAIASGLPCSETIFVDRPEPGSGAARAQIFTTAVEVPFAGHPVVGAAAWLRHQHTPVRTLQLPVGLVEVAYEGASTVVCASADWTPEFVIEQLSSAEEVCNADADDYSDGYPRYVWAWIEESAGTIRSRSFAPELGVDEDEATGAAAIRITDYLSRDLTIIQGRGSTIKTRWREDGWVYIGGLTSYDGVDHY